MQAAEGTDRDIEETDRDIPMSLVSVCPLSRATKGDIVSLCLCLSPMPKACFPFAPQSSKHNPVAGTQLLRVLLGARAFVEGRASNQRAARGNILHGQWKTKWEKLMTPTK